MLAPRLWPAPQAFTLRSRSVTAARPVGVGSHGLSAWRLARQAELLPVEMSYLAVPAIYAVAAGPAARRPPATGSTRSPGPQPRMSHSAASVARLSRSGTPVISRQTCSRDSATPRSADLAGHDLSSDALPFGRTLRWLLHFMPSGQPTNPQDCAGPVYASVLLTVPASLPCWPQRLLLGGPRGRADDLDRICPGGERGSFTVSWSRADCPSDRAGAPGLWTWGKRSCRAGMGA